MSRIKNYLSLHIILALFSIYSVFSKFAGEEEMLSVKWIVYYGISLAIMAAYAIGWQQVIKNMPIVTAYANKAVTVIWGIVWGALLFNERPTAGKIIGAIIIIAGVYLVVSSDDYDEANQVEADKGSCEKELLEKAGDER